MTSDAGATGLARFLDALAERSPAPGGGAAAAVTLGVAAALVTMAARFAGTRISDAEEVARRFSALSQDALGLAAADGAAYAAVIEVRRNHPPGDPQREHALETALHKAAEIPFEIASRGVEVAEAGARLAREGNPNLRGDALSAVHLAAGAAASAARLVAIDCAGLSDPRETLANDAAARAGAIAEDTAELT